MQLLATKTIKGSDKEKLDTQIEVLKTFYPHHNIIFDIHYKNNNTLAYVFISSM